MIRGLPAAINLEERVRQMVRAAQARPIGGATDGVNRLVLEQPKLVGRVRMRVLFLIVSTVPVIFAVSLSVLLFLFWFSMSRLQTKFDFCD